ncbi:hypothetical protein [Methylobacterium sp. Leaf118]|uniref:hypothetical protein n=1 Tax=Methylobacterium sp. Leaf118 TaxID=2876562 RepID=UPI001E510C25|nr:hypothetical protein [Methylobacterium sp. Leaf118]
MPDVNAIRERLATLVAERQGLGALASLDAGRRAAVEREVEALVDDGADHGDADASVPAPIREAIEAYREARRLRADEANVRLAERGEVFAPEDDA